MNPKILVVDDEKTIANTRALILAASCFETRAAYTATEALAIAQSDKPEVALIDVMLPEMTGAALGKAIAGFSPDAHLVVFGRP